MKTIRNGMASIEAILAIATGALVLMGIMQLTNSSLLPTANKTIAKLMKSDLTFPESNPDSSGDSDSSSDDNSDLGSNSDGSSVPQDVEPQDQGNGGDVSSDSDFVDPQPDDCLLYTSPSPRDRTRSRMPSSA